MTVAPNQRRVLLVGDSHVHGLAAPFKALAKAAGWDVIHYSNIGKSTAWFARQNVLASLVAQYDPRVVVIVLGTNDEGAERNPSDYRRNIETVLLQAGHSKVVWIGPPTILRSAEEDEGAARRNNIIAQQPGMLAVDGRAITADLTPLRSPDGVHFTVRGYKSWAERIFARTLPVMNSVSTSFSWKHLVVSASLATLVLAGVYYTVSTR